MRKDYITLKPACFRKWPSFETISWNLSCCQFTCKHTHTHTYNVMSRIGGRGIEAEFSDINKIMIDTAVVTVRCCGHHGYPPGPSCWQQRQAAWLRGIEPAGRARESAPPPRTRPQTPHDWHLWLTQPHLPAKHIHTHYLRRSDQNPPLMTPAKMPKHWSRSQNIWL